MRRIGLNLIFLVPGEVGGMETYARELIPALVAARPDIAFTAFVSEEGAQAGDAPWSQDIPAVTVPVRARRRHEWVRGEQQLLPPLARRAGIGLMHSLASTAPAWGQFRRVVTIHDLIYRRVPDAHSRLMRLGISALVPLAARRSARVIADSNSTKRDLVSLIGVPEAKVDVVPLGIGARRVVEPMPEHVLRRRHDVGERAIVLTVSAKRAHKNIGRLLEALAMIPPERRPVLFLPGYPTAHERELRERTRTLGLEPDTRFLDWVSADELEALYQAAACFVFPSLYEGFGLPVLEAMSRGVPVACSAGGALSEVAGDAAKLFDPTSARQIAEAITTVLSDPVQAHRLRRAGLARANEFTWEQTARLTLESYERAFAERPAP